MARNRPPDRLDQLLTCAARVFTANGYRRTQMADIAKAMGIAPGTLYLYVESKEALFHLLVQRGAAATVPPLTLPLRTPKPGATLALLRKRLATGAALPALEAALSRRRVTDPRAELERIVRELYASLSRNRESIRLLERSALDWPELAALVYQQMRRGLLQRLTQYLERRTEQKLLRPAPHRAAAARLIVEAVAWFALHRHGDADSALIDDRMAEETVVDAVVNAFAKE
jgi:AcrR family transcriptional regulator